MQYDQYTGKTDQKGDPAFYGYLFFEDNNALQHGLLRNLAHHPLQISRRHEPPGCGNKCQRLNGDVGYQLVVLYFDKSVYMKMLVNQEFIFYLCCGQTQVKNQVCPWQLFRRTGEHMEVFTKSGRENTEALVELVKLKVESTGISQIAVASSTGFTALKLVEALPHCTIAVVTLCTGAKEPDVQLMAPEVRIQLTNAGCHVITAAHAMGGLGRAVNNKFSTIQVDEIIAQSLKLFGQGTKVAVEVALMAADAGAVRTDKLAISIGGSSKGADTALVIRPANTYKFFDVKIDEIICKPRVSGLA
jgi:hypothetical protein